MEEELKVCDPEKTDHTRPIEEWRVERMQGEISAGFALLRKYRLAATFFGSARTKAGEPHYAAAEELGGKLARSGFTVITGGALGIMEAASKGAYEAKGQSVGLNIQLPTEQQTNAYLTEEMSFHYFFTRKVMLSFAAEVYIYFPGGFGTLNEFFEIVTLIQTRKIKRVPMILYGKDFWAPLLTLIEEELVHKRGLVDKEDTKLYTVVDSVEEAYQEVLKQVKC